MQTSNNQSVTVNALPQLAYAPSSRNTVNMINRDMHLSSYSFFFADILRTTSNIQHNKHTNTNTNFDTNTNIITPIKRNPFIKSFYINKTNHTHKSKSRTIPTMTTMNTMLCSGSKRKSIKSILKNDPTEGTAAAVAQDKDKDKDKDDDEALTNRKIISLVKRGSCLLPNKKKEGVNIAQFLTEANRLKYINARTEGQEEVELRIMNINRKVKMLKTINDYIYPHVLKAKEDSMKNEICLVKNKCRLRNNNKMKMLLDSNHVMVKSLYKQKEYHDRVYYYSNR